MNSSENPIKQARIKTKQGKGIAIHIPYEIINGEKQYRDYWRYSVRRNKKLYHFRLTSEKRSSEKLANEIHLFLRDPSNTIQDARAKFAAGNIRYQPKPGETDSNGALIKRVPTVGELIRTYNDLAQERAASTRKSYCQSLRRIAGYILECKPLTVSQTVDQRNRWLAKVDSLPVDQITTQKLESFRGNMIRSAGNDEMSRGRAIVTANMHIRNAGSMFSKKMRRIFSEFTLPEPCPFKEVGQLAERPHRYVSKVDLNALIEAAKRELRGIEDRKTDWIVVLLSLWAGLRRREIDRMIWDQVDFEKEHIWIMATPYYNLKTGNSASRVDCPSFVFEELRKFLPYSGEGPFVLPGGPPEYILRCGVVYKRLNKWLKGKGIVELKALHTLRKEAGSAIYQMTGSTDRAAEFLRNDPKTARMYYVGRKDRLEVNIGGID